MALLCRCGGVGVWQESICRQGMLRAGRVGFGVDASDLLDLSEESVHGQLGCDLLRLFEAAPD